MEEPHIEPSITNGKLATIYGTNLPKTNKTTLIRVDTELLPKLKRINPESYNKAIKQLLNISKETNALNKIRDLENSVMEIQEKLERITTLNKLRY